MLPAWAGGTRPKRPGGTSGGGPGGRPAGRLRSMLSRLKPAAGRRPAASGGASPGGAKTKPRSLFGRAASSVGRVTGRASRAVGSTLFRVRPGASSSTRPSGSSKPSGKGKPSGGGKGKEASLDLGLVWTGAGKAGKLVGRGVGSLYRRWKNRTRADKDDDFDPDSTYEIGIEGEVVNGKHTDAELGEVAKRARKLAKKRAKAAKKKAEEDAKKAPEWPNLDVDDVVPPAEQGPQPAQQQEPEYPPDYEPDIGDEDYDDHDEHAAEQSLPAGQDHDPPPSPPVSPPSHRETTGETPRITSTNTGGTAMSVSPTMFNELITSAPTRREGWQVGADAFRRKAAEFDENAKDHDNAARALRTAGALADAEVSEETARKLRDDANTCTTYAGKLQEKANAEASPAA